jgi:hypothetical protein
MQMKYEDFFELARYANENWKGYYTEEEVIQNAKNYQENYDWSKANGQVDDYTTMFLLNNLAEDWANGNYEVAKWLREMITELEMRDIANNPYLVDFIQSEM